MTEILLYTAPIHRSGDRETAHTLLRQAWRVQHPGSDLPVVRTAPGGKPDFSAGGHFSLSHGRTLSAVALCGQPAGVDVETIRPVHPRLYRRVLAEAEQACLSAAADPDETFLRFWTLKEAYLKYTGEGLTRLPAHLCFRLAADGTARLQDHPEIAAGTLRTEGCILAWCTRAPAVCRYESLPGRTESGSGHI